MYILLLIFGLLTAFYTAFLLKVLFGLKKVKEEKLTDGGQNFVTIIIPFRNESGVVLDCLKSLEEQDYPKEKYEIIFVDDFSDDDAVFKLNAHKKLSNTKIISVPKDFQKLSPKKRAVQFGIDQAKGEIIVTTDADCRHQQTWLSAMISAFDETIGFISGPVKFSNSNSFWGKVQQLEFGGLVLSGAGLIGTATPTICNAANIAFRKSAFTFVNGFDDNKHLASGDDEFLMQKIAKSNKYSVRFLFSEQAVVQTEANKTINKFIQQRKRWASKGLFYNDKALIFKLILIYFFFFSLPVQVALGIFMNGIFFYSFIVSALIKMVVEYSVLKKGVPILYPNINIGVFLVSELLHIPYIIFAGIAGAFGNFEWKGRNLKR